MRLKLVTLFVYNYNPSFSKKNCKFSLTWIFVFKYTYKENKYIYNLKVILETRRSKTMQLVFVASPLKSKVNFAKHAALKSKVNTQH